MHNHQEQHELIITVFTLIAREKSKSIKKIQDGLLIKQKPSINKKFWKILDQLFPGHQYSYVGCCAECGLFELRQALPTY